MVQVPTSRKGKWREKSLDYCKIFSFKWITFIILISIILSMVSYQFPKLFDDWLSSLNFLLTKLNFALNCIIFYSLNSLF